MRYLAAGVMILGIFGACAGPGAPVYSLLGHELVAPAPKAAQLEALEESRAAHLADPQDPAKTVWYGRRIAYTWDYRRAIDVYTGGIGQHPQYAPLYRHRGHRYISIRAFDRAIQDLQSAAALVKGRPDEVEADGIPNKLGIPTSTLKSNIWYHLGLAHYLKAEFEEAYRCYRECLEYAANPDMEVATLHWLYMTCRRSGRDEEASKAIAHVTSETAIIENESYRQLILMYKGDRTPEELLKKARGDDLQLATTAYGVGAWHLYNGRAGKARDLFAEVVRQPHWPAFGFIAAEAELARD